MNKHNTWIDEPTSNNLQVMPAGFIAKLQEVFSKAENDVAERFEGRACGVLNKEGIHECPICYFSKKVKDYLSQLPSIR